jgi:hypothetical protein
MHHHDHDCASSSILTAVTCALQYDDNMILAMLLLASTSTSSPYHWQHDIAYCQFSKFYSRKRCTTDCGLFLKVRISSNGSLIYILV